VWADVDGTWYNQENDERSPQMASEREQPVPVWKELLDGDLGAYLGTGIFTPHRSEAKQLIIIVFMSIGFTRAECT